MPPQAGSRARSRARSGARTGASHEAHALPVALPGDLARLLALTTGAETGGKNHRIGDFSPEQRRATTTFASLVAGAARSDVGRARLSAWLAGSIPFGTSPGGALWVYVLGNVTSPARGAVGAVDPSDPSIARLEQKDVSSFVLACALDESAQEASDAALVMQAMELRGRLASPGVAEQESVRASFDRAAALADLLTGSDAVVRRAAKKLATRAFEPPHPPTPKAARTRAARARTAEPPSSTRLVAASAAPDDGRGPLALGALVEAFFRDETGDLPTILAAQRTSADAIVREAAALCEAALAVPTVGKGAKNAKNAKPSAKRASDASRPTKVAVELARRRRLAARAAHAVSEPPPPSLAERTLFTKRIVELVEQNKPGTDPLATSDQRDEALLALGELGDRTVIAALVARAVTGDVTAVEMLGALGDPRAVAPLTHLLEREPQRYRVLEAAAVRALAALGATTAAPQMRALLTDNPMPSWREGIERGVLVRELVIALGELRDESAGPLLHTVLDSTSQEYRAIVPLAAHALGRIAYPPALPTLERLLTSPKDPVTCEAMWAVGEIGRAHRPSAERAATILERLAGNDASLEIVRLTALAKVQAGRDVLAESGIRRALERGLWEPAFRAEETSRRRTWALRSLEELAALHRSRDDRDHGPYFLGHDAVRYFVTRDDHRVRRAAELAFAAWGLAVPKTRRYYAPALDPLEARGGLDALHEALRDPLGIFRYNVAMRLAEIGDASSVRPLAEATARLFAEPPTSMYEYDDAPSHLVVFVRALAKLNRPEGNDVLIEGLRAGNHQVRAVVAENAPDDARFVPELMAMLGDPRSFLRSRAERSLTALGVSTRAGSEAPRGSGGSDAPGHGA